MGTKFGNVHVRTADLEELSAALRQMTEKRIKPNPGGESGFDELLAKAFRSQNIYYLGKFDNGWTSILNNGFG